MKKLRYELIATAPNQSFKIPITQVKQSEYFDVVIVATDIRPPGLYTYDGQTKRLTRGVFAAYVDVVFESYFARDVGVGFNNTYCNKRIYQSLADGMYRIGGFMNIIGTYYCTQPVEIARIKFQAISEPIDSFFNIHLSSEREAHPTYSTLVYGLTPEIVESLSRPDELSYVKPEDVICKNLSFNIVA